MDRGILYSGVGHVGLVLWALFGGAFLSPRELPEMTVTSVSLMSSAEFDAMAAAVPATPEPAPATAESVDPAVDAPEPVEPAVEPDAVAAEVPPPEPELAASDLPALPAIREPPPLPQAETEQPLPSVTNSVRPLPRPAPRVAPLPSEAPPPEAEVADEVVPEVSPDAIADAPVVEEDQPAVAPEEATSQIITEVVETDEASELAPASTNRPRARPAQVAAAVNAPEFATEPVEPEDIVAEEPTETDADAVTAALAAAMAETPAEEPSLTADTAGAAAPTGPPMTSGEKDALRVAVQRCWNVGALSSEALRVTVTVAVSLSQAGQPDGASIRMLEYEGGSDAAARQAYEAARRAVIRCGADGFDLPAEKFAQWQNLELVFNPEGMRMK